MATIHTETMTLKKYQANIKLLLEEIFHSETSCEWNTKMDLQIYSPRPDIAVGPFSLENNTDFIKEYDRLYEANSLIIKKLISLHLNNIYSSISKNDLKNLIEEKFEEMKYFNFNSRCFIAIEVENKTSRKHLMGGALNASVLGRIGIAVGYNDKKHTAFLNLYRYFEFLQKVRKPTFRTCNLLIISHSQLADVLEKATRGYSKKKRSIT